MAIKQLSVNKGTQDLFLKKTVVGKKEGEKNNENSEPYFAF